MAFKAIASFSNEKFEVENVRFGLSRQMSPDGLPSSGFQQSLINLTIRVTEGSKIIEDQVNNLYKPIGKIEIEFKKATEDAALQKVILENAYLVDVRQEFNANNESPLLVTHTFSCQKLQIDGAKLEASTDWSKI
ncbi:type VI secretion system tube protein TssD [Taibaiella soli]|uniref:Type VI secretion system needle protein Hcp n=1 Tax=Taibaiella soli TaxID=1649169 RepID=A0A2W2C0L2_9BACT|nr:type VI secretion system tube protein TssD [Taibaiella soli]PZF73603.1 hypothetical protein DN068_07730 [Taibaiella soli]